MKVASVIILFLIVTVKASFFDDFTSAMSSVENSVGKLLNDVVSDVKSTVHCTIFAMQQVLAVNGVMSEPTGHKECYNDDAVIGTNGNNHHFRSAKDIAQEIDASISKVNKTLNHILDNDGHERLKDVKRVLKDESNRLVEVSSLLRQELDKLSKRFRKELQGIDLNADKSSLESVWNNMKILYEAEKKDKNISDEIGHVFNEALNVLHIDPLTNSDSDEDKIKAIMQELKKEPNNYNVPISTTNEELSQANGMKLESENDLGHKIVNKNTPNDSPEIAGKILQQIDDIRKESVDYITDKTSTFLNKVSNGSKQTDNKVSKSPKADSDVSSPFGETTSEDSKKAVDEAMDILKNTADTQAVLDNFFTEKHGTENFDNSQLLNF